MPTEIEEVSRSDEDISNRLTVKGNSNEDRTFSLWARLIGRMGSALYWTSEESLKRWKGGEERTDEIGGQMEKK